MNGGILNSGHATLSLHFVPFGSYNSDRDVSFNLRDLARKRCQ